MNRIKLITIAAVLAVTPAASSMAAQLNSYSTCDISDRFTQSAVNACANRAKKHIAEELDDYGANKETVATLVEALGKAIDLQMYAHYFLGGLNACRTSFEERVHMAMSPKFAQRFPGSNVQACDISGNIVDGVDEVQLSFGQITKVTVRSVGDGLTREIFFNNASVRISDASGNYITFLVRPMMVLDVRLPLVASSALSTANSGKGVNFTNNELIAGFNAFMPKVKNLFMFTNGMLLNPQFREDVLADIVKQRPVKAKSAAAAAPAAVSTDDELARVRAEIEALKSAKAEPEVAPAPKSKNKKK